jgi:predicted nucleic-acid-binding Zn-ribbon protein
MDTAGNETKSMNEEISAASPRELAEVFNRRFPDFKCSVCGSQNFSLIDDPETSERSRLLLFRDEHALPSSYIATVSFACQTCGNVYSFVRNSLLATGT